MKRTTVLVSIALCIFASCRKDNASNVLNTSAMNSQKNTGHPPSSMMRLSASGPFSQFIPIDSANRMLGSYLTSINYPYNDSDLQSLIFNADTLRHYLQDSRIVNIKIMLAHTLAYINKGNYGVPSQYQSGELTVIVVGYDNNNNYIYNPQNMVLEHAMPCPDWCPSIGTAQYPTLNH
jgi:hypothetical protein